MPNGQVDVTNGAPNLQSFTDNGDRTVTDSLTGLMWQRDPGPMGLDWTAAVNYCPTSTVGGHTDWRLPTIIELASLIDSSYDTYAAPVFAFASTTATQFWSSTPMAGTAYDYVVEFADGHVDGYQPQVTLTARCVR
jgi:hypothetical protein